MEDKTKRRIEQNKRINENGDNSLTWQRGFSDGCCSLILLPQFYHRYHRCRAFPRCEPNQSIKQSINQSFRNVLHINQSIYIAEKEMTSKQSKLHQLHYYVQLNNSTQTSAQRNWIFATNSIWFIPIYFKPNCVNLDNRLVNLTEFIVRNIQCL